MPQPISAGFWVKSSCCFHNSRTQLPSGKAATAHTHWRTVEEVVEEGTGANQSKGSKGNTGFTNPRSLN